MAPQKSVASDLSHPSTQVNDQDRMVDLADKVENGYITFPTTPSTHNTNSNTVGDVLTSNTAKSSRFVVQSVHLRECLAEFLGTFVMICFGMGVNNQVVNSSDKNGTWLSINMCWGIAVMLGVHCSEGISGAHLNPTVTVAHAFYHRLPWWKVPGYVLAQTVAAFIGAFCIYLLNYNTLNVVDPDRDITQSSFATYPSENITNLTAFYTEFLASAMLVLGVYAITDKRNRPAGPFNAPIAFAFLIMAIGMAFGMNTGYAINPARDFGPRLFTCLAGWGTKVFTLRNHYFWIPLVAPLLGGIVGGGAYEIFVEMHHPALRVDQPAVVFAAGDMV